MPVSRIIKGFIMTLTDFWQLTHSKYPSPLELPCVEFPAESGGGDGALELPGTGAGAGKEWTWKLKFKLYPVNVGVQMS